MPKIGMIGGTGPESTVDYYQRIIALYQQMTGTEEYPEIIISSVNMTHVLDLVDQRDWKALTDLLSREVNGIYQAGASMGFLSANTPHVVFDRLQALSPIPLISIVASARSEAEKLGLKKIGLMGTLFTMQSHFYQKEFDKIGASLVVPNAQEQKMIQEKLMTEIEKGVFLDQTRQALLNIVKRMIEENSIEGVILGCTELPLILTKDEFGIPFLNTTKIHVQDIVRSYLKSTWTETEWNHAQL